MMRCLKCDQIILRGGLCPACSGQLQRQKDAARRDALGMSGTAWQLTRVRVWERDGGQCQLADDDCDPLMFIEDCEIDHIIEVADGGTSDDDNLRVLCKHHHRVKTTIAARLRRARSNGTT